MKFIKILTLVAFFNIGTFLSAGSAATITYEDIIKFSKPKSIKISPDGSRIAYALQRGVIESNTNIDTIYFYDLSKKRHSKIFETSSLLQIEWNNQGDTIYVLSKEVDCYQINKCTAEIHELLIRSDDPITIFQIDDSENTLIYAKTKYDPDDLIQNRIENGYVYQWQEDNRLSFCKRTYRKKQCEEIFLLKLSSKKEEILTKLYYNNFWNSDIDFVKFINKIVISPDQKFIAFEKCRRGRIELGELPFTRDVIVWNNQSHCWINQPGKDILGTKANPCWIDNQKFVFQLESTREYTCKLYVFDCFLQKEVPLEFSTDFSAFDNIVLGDQNQLIGLTSTDATILSIADNTHSKIPLPVEILPKNPCIIPSIDNKAHYLATFCESSNVPPEVVVYNIQNGEHEKVSSLNPWIDCKQLGYVEEITFTTKNGIQSNGYLLHPVDEQPNTRYPLIIGTYGFSGGFVLDAEWHTTFPSQVLSAEGYLVLLLNDAPGQTQNLVGDHLQAMQNEGWNALELFETAVDQLVEKGIADPEKVGLYGWSHGGFMVNFLISHSTKFKAACYGEGADYNPSGYWWCGDDGWAKIFHNTFGGPPWGETLENYRSFCPLFNIENIKTPVLMEYAEIGCMGYEFEMYVPLRILHKPAELVLYKDEEHNFVRPKARLASMKRKVDWFNFWILNKKDAAPILKEQYERWEAMKNECSY
ncbi:MAG: Dipeptidyl-peptidase 5 [Chlamydiae bacterium]|nr:Dipeptidyl-peptidase 5 [Chlamydiota bacterium]